MEEEKNEAKELKDQTSEQPKEAKKAPEEPQVEEERNGVLPDNMDFKKFIGCGG